jgi:hypothetical protein
MNLSIPRLPLAAHSQGLDVSVAVVRLCPAIEQSEYELRGRTKPGRPVSEPDDRMSMKNIRLLIDK